MKVIWTPKAEQDRADIWDYIAADNPGAAVRMDELFSDAAARLAAHPKMGKPGKIAGTRELIPHENYRLAYEIEGDTVWVLALTRILRKIDRYYCETSLRIFLLDFKNPMSVDGIKRYFAEFGGMLRG